MGWGWDQGMIPTLRQLKTLADSGNLNALFLDPNTNGEMNCSLQVLTEKTMMLFLLLCRGEALSREQLFNFLYQKASEKSKASGQIRIAKILKILVTLQLIQQEEAIISPNLDRRSKMKSSFKYVGPHIEAYADEEVYEIVEVTTIVEVVEDGEYQVKVIPKILGQCIKEDSIEIVYIDEAVCDLQENLSGNYDFGDILVKDEIMED